MSNQWYVYFLRCADQSVYAGITTNLTRRVDEHNHSNKLGAKYTRVRRPVTLVYSETCPSRSEASKKEYLFKKLNKAAKERIIKDYALSQSLSSN